MKPFVKICLGCFLVIGLVDTIQAQREEFVFRTEFFPATGLAQQSADASTRYEGEVTGYSQYLSIADRSVLNKKGTSLLTSKFSYRYTSLSYSFEEQQLTTIPVQPVIPVPNETMAYVTELDENGMQLHLIQADFLLMRSLNKKWLLYTLARPMLATDFDGITLDAARVEAAIFTEYRFSRKFRGGLGLSRSSGFGRVLWIPLARVFYRPTKRILVDGILPSRVDAWYLPNKQWEVGLGVSLIGAQFSVNEDTYGSADQLGWANGITSLQVKRLLKGKWYAQFDAGISVVPRQEFTRYDYNLFPTRDVIFDLDPDLTPVLRFGVFKTF
ncbi:MAG: DUF6268 family outer membrane beta-barrel protein [Bacteroidota bacterium]